MEAFFVYILQSQKSKRFYTGMTNDLERRLQQHNNGFNKSTRNKGPWIKVWNSESLPKGEAQTLERTIKKRGAARYLGDLKS